MQTLAGVDTSKVYHEFSFDSDRLKHLKCGQWFIHNDLVELVQGEFDKLSQSNEIKIVYEQINHFDFNHVKCVEVYCENLHASFANDFMVQLQAIVQYKLPWKGTKTYFIKHRLKYPSDVTEMRETNFQLRSALEDNHLLTHLIKSYKLSVYWFGEHDLTCYEFGTNLNSHQRLTLEKIFKREPHQRSQQSIFVSREFNFLGDIEPPMIMKIEVLTAFHGQYLADLNIEDILSLELANKDHRLSYYDHDLDHDIQKHLRKRFPLLYTNKKLDTYFCHEFRRVTILRYFIYKYHDRFTTLNIPNGVYILDNAKIIMAEYKHLIFNFPEDYSSRVDIISPEGMTVCSVSFIMSKDDLTDVSIDPVYSNTKQVRMDQINTKFSLEEWVISENRAHNCRKWRCVYYELSIQPNCQLDILLNVMKSVMTDLYIGTFFNIYSVSIVRLTAFDGYRITDSMLNKIFKGARCPHPDIIIVQFKQITFDKPTVIKWFKQIRQFVSVTFIDCNLLSCYSYTKLYKTIMNKLTNIFSNPESKLNVNFKNMRLDIRTIDLILNNLPCRMVCDNCHIIPSADKILLPKQLPQNIQFKNMTVESASFIRITTNLLEVSFYNCHIQSKYDALFKTHPSMKSSRIIQYAAFFDTDIEEGALILIAHHVRVVKLENCRIRCGSNNHIIIDDFVNRPITNITITFTSMEIDIKTLHKILYKLNDVTFDNCRILCAIILTPIIHLIELSKLTLFNMNITRELTNILSYFDVENNVITFRDCRITNKNVLEMWRRTSERQPKLYIEGSHQVNEFIYFELLGKYYENEFNQLLSKFKDGVSNPFKNFILIEWGNSSLSHIDWHTIKIRSILVNDGTIKLEYLQNDEVVDLFYEQNNLPNDSDVCEVDYY